MVSHIMPNGQEKPITFASRSRAIFGPYHGIPSLAANRVRMRTRMNDNELYCRYVYTYKEFVIVTEAPQCKITATGQDTE